MITSLLSDAHDAHNSSDDLHTYSLAYFAVISCLPACPLLPCALLYMSLYVGVHMAMCRVEVHSHVLYCLVICLSFPDVVVHVAMCRLTFISLLWVSLMHEFAIILFAFGCHVAIKSGSHS